MGLGVRETRRDTAARGREQFGKATGLVVGGKGPPGYSEGSGFTLGP